MHYEAFRRGVLAEILSEPTVRAVAALCDREAPDLAAIRGACWYFGARVPPVAAYFGFLRRLSAPDDEYVDVTQPDPWHATVDTSDPELLCCFALWRHRREQCRIKVVVQPERPYPRRAAPERPMPSSPPLRLHPHHRCDD